MSLRVAVIGAGVIGSCVAAELQRRGAQVVVWDRSGPGQGTSATTFAWTNAHAKVPRAYFELNQAGCREHEELQRRRSPMAPWYVPSGNLVWAAPGDEDQLIERTRTHAEWGGTVRWLTQQAASELEPDLRISPDVEHVALFADEGYVIPAQLIGAMLATARTHGAEFLFGEEVTAIETTTRTMTVRGRREQRQVDRIVVCAGRWTDGVRRLYGETDPILVPPEAGSPAVGMVALSDRVPTSLGRVVTSPHLDLRPVGDGSLLLHASDVDARVDPEETYGAGHPLAVELGHRLDQVLVTHSAARMRHLQVGLRVLPRDGRTVAGPSPVDPRIYEIATHSGVTLAAVLGRMTASELLDEHEQGLLEEFRPGRSSLRTPPQEGLLGPGGQ